jgi:aryl-alcohol dehydrogenase-like predicted oxidoreductase
MRYRELGNAGLKLSEIGIGGWGIGGMQMVEGRPNSYGASDDDEAVRMIHWAIDQGVNFIDTAPAYGFGHSEEVIGRATHDRRDKVVLETKVGEHYPDGKKTWSFEPEFVRRSLDESLRRLRTDYLDSYMLHLPMDGGVSVEQALAAMDAAAATGKVKVVGASIYDNTMGIELMRSGRCQVIQQALSLLQPDAAAQLLPEAKRLGVGVIVRQALFRGFLTDAVERDTVFDATDLRSSMPHEVFARHMERRDELAFLWQDGRRRRLDAAIQYALGQPAVASVICGAISRAELAESVAAADAPALTAEELARVAEVHARQLAGAPR